MASAVYELDAEIQRLGTRTAERKDSESEAAIAGDLKRARSERTKAKRTLKSIDAELLGTAHQTFATLTSDQATELALQELQVRIETLVKDHFSETKRRTFGWYENLAEKYGIVLPQLQAETDLAVARLTEDLGILGYG